MQGKVLRNTPWSLKARDNELWRQLNETSREVKDVLGLRSVDSALFFVLVRDYLVEIAPIVEGAGIDPHSLVLRAHSDMLEGNVSRSGVRATARRLQAEWKVEGSPFVLFAAFIRDGASPLTAELKSHLDLGVMRKYAQEPRADVVIAGAPSLQLQNRAVSDLPSHEDHLGITPLVQGLHTLLEDPGTSLPLAMAVTAPWGGGKSSLMLQLEDELAFQEGSRTRTWIPIRFDAWKYERGERLWAALGKAIYSQPQEKWNWQERIRFKMRLQWRRAGGLSFFVKGVIVPLVLAIGTVALAVVQDALLGATLLGAVSLLALGNSVTRVLGIVSDPFKRALDQYVERPKYEEQLGFTFEADSDIAELTMLLTEDPGTALAIFIDDLDRCSPTHVVEVVEAINQIFNCDAKRQCVFILGMDRELVAASIEVAYESTIKRLRNKGRADNFGFDFLAKLVQLSVAIPPPGSEDVERLLASMTQQSVDGTEPDRRQVEKFEARISERDPSTVSEVEEIFRDLDQNLLSVKERDALDEAKFRERSKLLGSDSPTVHEAEREVSRFIQSNPREIKRFDNAFRLQLQVANRTPGCALKFDLDDLIALGKWVVLKLRWPALAERLESQPELLKLLEDQFNGLEHGEQAEFGDDPELKRILTEAVERRRVGRLLEHTFLRVS
jgi:hypothetical protein